MDIAMEADQVIAKIIQEAKEQADKIKGQALEKWQQEKASLDASIAEYEQQTQAMAQKAAKDQVDHMLAQARMQLAKEFLSQKRQVLDEVFEQAAQRIKALPAQQYRDFIANLMVNVATGDQEVIIDTNEGRIDQALIDQVNSRLSGMGRPAGLRLSSQRQPIEAGFVLKKGMVRTNCSLAVILGQARRELEMQLAGQLFA